MGGLTWEAIRISEHKRVQALCRDYRAEALDPDDPRITGAVENYKVQMGLPAGATPAAQTWFGVFDREDLVLVVGERKFGDVLDITDLYPCPGVGRRGVVAIYSILMTYKGALASGLYKAITATVLFTNSSFQRAIARTFGVRPSAFVYVAETTAN